MGVEGGERIHLARGDARSTGEAPFLYNMVVQMFGVASYEIVNCEGALEAVAASATRTVAGGRWPRAGETCSPYPFPGGAQGRPRRRVVKVWGWR